MFRASLARRLAAAAPIALVLTVAACTPAPSGTGTPGPTTTIDPNTPATVIVRYSLDDSGSGPLPLTVVNYQWDAAGQRPGPATPFNLGPAQSKSLTAVPGQTYEVGPFAIGLHVLNPLRCVGTAGPAPIDVRAADSNRTVTFQPKPGDVVTCTWVGHQVRGSLTLVNMVSPTVQVFDNAKTIIPESVNGVSRYADFVGYSAGPPAVYPYLKPEKPAAGVMIDLRITAPGLTTIYCTTYLFDRYVLYSDRSVYRTFNAPSTNRINVGANELATCSSTP